MERYNGHPLYVSAIPLMGQDRWYPLGLVFAPTETESPYNRNKEI
jgi:hypothetical protein